MKLLISYGKISVYSVIILLLRRFFYELFLNKENNHLQKEYQNQFIQILETRLNDMDIRLKQENEQIQSGFQKSKGLIYSILAISLIAAGLSLTTLIMQF